MAEQKFRVIKKRLTLKKSVAKVGDIFTESDFIGGIDGIEAAYELGRCEAVKEKTEKKKKPSEKSEDKKNK